MGARRGRLSAPWSRFHGVGRADVYIIIRVRASGCGESALNPPTSQHILRRKPAPAPAQRRALPEHFRSPTQRRRTPADLTTHSPPTSRPIPRRPHNPFPAEDLRPSCALPPAPAAQTRTRRPHNPFSAESLLPPPHCDTPFPSTFAPPRSADARPPTSPPIPHRRPAPAPAHFRSPTQPRRTPADCAMHSSPTSQHIPRRRPAPAPAQRHALPEHFLTPSPPRRTPAGCAMHSSPTSQHIPRRRSAPTPAQRRALPLPSCHIPAAQTHARRPHHPFLAEACHPSPHSDTPLPLRSTSGTKKRHRTVDVRCRMSRSTVVAVGHWGW